MSNTKKITKKDSYNALLAAVDYVEGAGYSFDEGITADSLREFINHEIELLNNKAVAAQKRAATKKQEGDALREKVLNVLSETELMTIDEIVDVMDDPDVTRNMVTSRLGQLGEKGTNQVVKEMVSVDTNGAKARKVAAYRRIG